MKHYLIIIVFVFSKMSLILHVIYNFYDRFGLRHILVALLLILYSVAGALLFMSIEGPPEEALLKEKYDQSFKRYTNNINNKKLIMKFRNEVNKSYGEIVEWCLRDELFKKPELERTNWTFWGSIFYASTIYTTIGYGSFAPTTTWGRIATIVYAIVGIPMAITILNLWGNLMFYWTNQFWNLSLQRFRKFCTKKSCKRKRCLRCCWAKVKKDQTFETEIHEVPLVLALLIFLFLVCLSAGIYCIWEKWSYFKSMYFFFISLTTIGMGDIVPTNMKFAVFTLFLVLVGLAAVKMSINVLQAKVEQLFGNVEESINQVYKESLERGGMDDALVKSLENMQKSKGFGRSVAFRFMGNHEKKMLQNKLNKVSKYRTRACQTETDGVDGSMQTEEDVKYPPRDVYVDIF